VIAGMIGEANFIELIPYENTEDAKRWSENIFHLLNHESKLKEFGNIVKGCYYLEELTHELSVGAWDLFLQIESNGGYSEYIENGELEKEIAVEREKSIEKMMLGEVKLVGLNSFRRHEPDKFNGKDQGEFNQESEIYHFSNWIEKCHQLANASWDCLILEGASEQEEELMKNVLFTLHSIGLKNKIDADVLFIAGDEKKVNFFQLMNQKKRLVRIVEEVSEDEKYSMSEITQLPELITELMKVEVQK
jgi:methylmalonyl-CoA mutase N-terminal domain/subunit